LSTACRQARLKFSNMGRRAYQLMLPS
jgi:hypothetical protein